MKILQLREVGGPENLEINEISKPEPGEEEVRVKIKSAALNRRDYWMTVGAYPGLSFPATPGSDGSGIVDAIGPNVDGVCIGDEVVIYPALEWGDDPRCGGDSFRVLGMPDQGTFAEYICVPETSIMAKPKHLGWNEAAAIPLAGMTAWRAVVSQGQVQPGQKTLVTGIGGGCATFALTWAHRHGSEVFVTSGSEDKLSRAESLGAKRGFNYKDPQWHKTLLKEEGGVDLVIDSGGGDGIHQVIDCLNPGGRYVFFGATLGNPKAGFNMAKLFFKQIRIQGTTMGSPIEFQEMLNYVEKHRIAPVVDTIYPFEEAVSAHKKMESSEQMGKLVLKIG